MEITVLTFKMKGRRPSLSILKTRLNTELGSPPASKEATLASLEVLASPSHGKMRGESTGGTLAVLPALITANQFHWYSSPLSYLL